MHNITTERRDLLRKMQVEGLTVEEMAARLGIAKGTVQAQLNKLGMRGEAKALPTKRMKAPFTEDQIAAATKAWKERGTIIAVQRATGMGQDRTLELMAKLFGVAR